MRALFLALALSFAGLSPSLAVQPDEMLKDPALEARARAIRQELRCPVCQGENIDDSGAGVARDLRLLVRERLAAGDTDRQVVDYVVARYGEYVLFDPPRSGANLILWLAGPAAFVAGLGGFLLWRRGRGETEAEPVPLTPDEEARLRELTKS